MEIRLSSSTTFTLTGTETSYISHCHCTCLPSSSLPLLLVNQNFIVMSGLMNASNTSATGRRMSIPVFITGVRLSCRLSIESPLLVELCVSLALFGPGAPFFLEFAKLREGLSFFQEFFQGGKDGCPALAEACRDLFAWQVVVDNCQLHHSLVGLEGKG